MNREQLDGLYHLANLQEGFAPQTDLSRECAFEINRENDQLFQDNPRLADLANLYLALEEMGAALEIVRSPLADWQTEAWVSAVCQAQEIILKETGLQNKRTFPNPKVFSFCRELHQKLLKKNRVLLQQKPKNVFHSLGYILHNSLEKAGIKFVQTQETTRGNLAEDLKTNPLLESLLTKISLSELAEKTCFS